MCNARELILIFAYFHVTKVMCVADNFSCYVRMVQMYHKVNNSMDTFEKNSLLAFHSQIYLEENQLISDKQKHKFAA